MATHPNKHIRAAIEYAEQCGWELVKSGARAHSFGALYCPIETVKGASSKYSARRAIPKVMQGGSGGKSTAVHMRGP